MADLIRVDDPYTGEIVAEVPLVPRKEVDAVLGRADRAQREWALAPIDSRVALVGRFCERAEARTDEIARDLTRQMGKPQKQARREVATMIERARAMARLAPAALADEELPSAAGARRVIRREPLGVVLDIAPWNYPLLTAVNFVAPAVLAGNAVLVKHAARTPLCGDHFAKLFAEAGAPEGLVQSVPCDHTTASALIADRRVAFVAFTGSVRGGRDIYRQAAERIIDVGLELGGKDPAYVMPDADLARTAAELADGAFYNAGQSCCGVERIYVHRDVYAPFCDALAAAAAPWRPGDPSDAATTLGPMAQADAPAFLAGQIAEARGKGARVLTGGAAAMHDGRGRFFAATVAADATHAMSLMVDESFGPVVGVAPVAGDDEAVARMNDSPYGLTASLWTPDTARADRLAARVSAGTVYLNRCDVLDPELPWSGVRESGKGCSLGRLGFLALTRPKSLLYRLWL